MRVAYSNCPTPATGDAQTGANIPVTMAIRPNAQASSTPERFFCAMLVMLAVMGTIDDDDDDD